MIRRPQNIKPGMNIGITAPSFGPGTEPYRSMYFLSKENIEKRGYKIIEGETLFKTDGLGIATDPKFAAKELVEFWNRSDIDAIISAGGGELMNETITNVDFEALKGSTPKWYIGYSDNTNFIFPLVTISGIQGIYGPCISGFSKTWEEPEYDAMALLEGSKTSFTGYEKFVNPYLMEKTDESGEKTCTKEELMAPYDYNDEKVLSTYVCNGGKSVKVSADENVVMEGILIGGCLDVLANMVGTRFDRVKEFKKENPQLIWVLEACDLTPMSIRRSLWNLRESGWFDGAAGFVIGRSLAAFEQDMMGVNRFNAVTDVLAPVGAPVIIDADIGHIDPMLPVIMGANARVSAKGNEFKVEYI
ncbi:MAG: LD-carboxypeptidase [Butyrivibrio sp.]|nr:LD-carboxypeptidase [Butyrivibrio sp.]